MLEMGTSGLMSGEGKRAGCFALRTAPFLDSTPVAARFAVPHRSRRRDSGPSTIPDDRDCLLTGVAEVRIPSGDPNRSVRTRSCSLALRPGGTLTPCRRVIPSPSFLLTLAVEIDP